MPRQYRTAAGTIAPASGRLSGSGAGWAPPVNAQRRDADRPPATQGSRNGHPTPRPGRTDRQPRGFRAYAQQPEHGHLGGPPDLGRHRMAQEQASERQGTRNNSAKLWSQHPAEAAPQQPQTDRKPATASGPRKQTQQKPATQPPTTEPRRPDEGGPPTPARGRCTKSRKVTTRGTGRRLVIKWKLGSRPAAANQRERNHRQPALHLCAGKPGQGCARASTSRGNAPPTKVAHPPQPVRRRASPRP
jgi:hypothetical protein